MQFLPTQKSPKIRSGSRLPVVEEDCSVENRVAGWIKLKVHNKISLNSRRRRGGGEVEWRRNREKEQMEEKKIMPWILKR